MKTQHSDNPINNILKAYKTVFWYVLWFSVATNMLLFSLPIFSLQVFDRVISSASNNTLLMLAIVVTIALIGYGIIHAARTLALGAVNHWVDKHITPQLLKASIQHSSQGQKILMGKHIYNLNNIGGFITNHAVTFFFDAPWSVVFIAVMFYMHPALGMISVVGCLAIFVTAYIYEVATRPLVLQSEEAYAKQIQIADEAIHNAEAIKALGMSRYAVTNFETQHKVYVETQRLFNYRSTLILSILKVIRYVLQIMVTGVGIYLVIDEKITVGTVIACSILSSRAFAPFEGAVMAWKSFVSTRNSYNELKQTFAGDVLGEENATRPVPEGKLVLEDVSYISPITMKPIVKNVSLTVGKGKVLGIMGPNGAGKTTLVKLMAGVLQPSKGEVLLDSMDLFKATKSEFGQYIGYLPQNPQLFQATVAKNIARMDPSTDVAEKVMKAARIVCANDMILRMPQSYETHLGKDGILLSSGQRQLVSLARAYYGDPKLLILDEPSTSLDYHGEVGLLKAIKHAKEQGMTIIIVSHSKTLLSYCDDLCIVVQGEVKQHGPADRVLKQAIANRTIHE